MPVGVEEAALRAQEHGPTYDFQEVLKLPSNHITSARHCVSLLKIDILELGAGKIDCRNLIGGFVGLAGDLVLGLLDVVGFHCFALNLVQVQAKLCVGGREELG